jgi:hypothetical protein
MAKGNGVGFDVSGVCRTLPAMFGAATCGLIAR